MGILYIEFTVKRVVFQLGMCVWLLCHSHIYDHSQCMVLSLLYSQPSTRVQVWALA